MSPGRPIRLDARDRPVGVQRLALSAGQVEHPDFAQRRDRSAPRKSDHRFVRGHRGLQTRIRAAIQQALGAAPVAVDHPQIRPALLVLHAVNNMFAARVRRKVQYPSAGVGQNNRLALDAIGQPDFRAVGRLSQVEDAGRSRSKRPAHTVFQSPAKRVRCAPLQAHGVHLAGLQCGGGPKNSAVKLPKPGTRHLRFN